MDNWQQRTIALAGILQATIQVDRLATHGQIDKQAFHTAVQSLLEQNPENATAPFGGLGNLTTGLEAVTDVLSSNYRHNSPQPLRYTLGVLHIQSKLSRSKDTLAIIGSRLEQTNQQARHFEITHDNIVASLADIYQDTISKFRFRIQVRGDATYLQQQRVAAQIRTLLFAGVRAAILWHQLGGRRWQIVLRRHKLLGSARELLKEAKQARLQV